MLHCFAQRRLNPFQGVLQVALGAAARALSSNGRVWEIQVLTERPAHTWRSFSPDTLVEQFFTFGLWDPEEGMSRIPANPLLDIGNMQRAADSLVAELAPCLARLPFPLEDRYECWSTDSAGEPVALLGSTHRAEHAGLAHAAPWQLSTLADHGFHSATLAASGMAAVGDLGPRRHAAYLESRVRRRGPRKAWFERRPGGSGHALDGGRELPADSFPRYGIRHDWDDAPTTGLVDDYIAWIAPQLLTLQDLARDERAGLEALAVLRATELARQYPLIPEIVDRAAVQAARVEAGLRDSLR